MNEPPIPAVQTFGLTRLYGNITAVDRLDHLVDLGVDLVELLPVNAVNGTHNWGYDGVGW